MVVNLLSGPTWTSGSTYNLVGYGSFGGAASNFTLGTVAGDDHHLIDTGAGQRDQCTAHQRHALNRDRRLDHAA